MLGSTGVRGAEMGAYSLSSRVARGVVEDESQRVARRKYHLFVVQLHKISNFSVPTKIIEQTLQLTKAHRLHLEHALRKEGGSSGIDRVLNAFEEYIFKNKTLLQATRVITCTDLTDTIHHARGLLNQTETRDPALFVLADYQFRGNTQDSSIYKNHCINRFATLTKGYDDTDNSAYYFSNSAMMNCGRNIDASAMKTIEVFVKFDSLIARNRAIVSKSHGGGGVELITGIDGLGGGYLCLFAMGGQQAFACYSTEFLNIGQWYHVVGTQDGSGGKPMGLFVDGVEIGVGFTPLSIANTGELRLGNWNSDVWESRPFDGALSSVRIYNKSLSSDEVMDLYLNKSHYFNSLIPTPAPTLSIGGGSSEAGFWQANEKLIIILLGSVVGIGLLALVYCCFLRKAQGGNDEGGQGKSRQIEIPTASVVICEPSSSEAVPSAPPCICYESGVGVRPLLIAYN